MLFPDSRGDLVLKLAGCWGPRNNQISYFKTIFGYFSRSDLTPPPSLDVFFPPFYVFIFCHRMSVLYNLRMRSGLLLFLFTQVISVASLTQTGRC